MNLNYDLQKKKTVNGLVFMRMNILNEKPFIALLASDSL